jgi:DNA-binding NarL/FixJ family response regulator
MSSGEEPIKLLIVDDDALTRDGLKAGLSAEGGFIIQEAGDGYKALEYFKDDKPDVVLLDLRMPSLDGIETMRKLKDLDNNVPIVIMTAYGDIPTAVEAMKTGAYDFTVKPPNLSQLRATLKRAAETSAQRTGDPGAKRTSGKASAPEPDDERYKALTEREREIFTMTVQGLSSTQIADRLSISRRTVETHREHLMEKLDAHNKADLFRCAGRLGLLR